MAYTICNEYGDPKPLRLLVTSRNDVVTVAEPFTPFWWVCDPCNRSSERIEITFQDGYAPQKYHWYEVVLSDDSDDDIRAKVEHYAVIEAAKKLEAARREYARLNGSL
jgi:hypothetical protein